ncbi:uncharacterized protein LOC118436234 [Folsomia candida]|uniref:uncharacterized protein LOC118436234 n=1 Tax=Folsomia candida TaxID=158441 RepID=UPI001604EE18|nr:uncharacterized protein LOC118436234 [Folsomia candida]
MSPINLSPLIIMLISFQLRSSHALNFTSDELDKIKEIVDLEVARTTYNKSLSEVFRQTTGHSLETVVIICVIVMTIPSILINVLFFAVQWALQTGATVVCCCCKLGVKAGTTAVGCCCKTMCPCQNDPPSATESTPLLQSSVEKEK